MPRCQRTFFRLRERSEKRDVATSEGTSWRCPHCAEAETYETVTDADLIEYAKFAEAECIRDFGAPQDASRQYSLWLGLRPECVFEPSDRRYEIYLQQGSDLLQLRFQIGHEMFHRICSRGRIFHWIHEMFASLAAVSLLRRDGHFTDYADRVDAYHRINAELLSIATMTTMDLFAAITGSEGGLSEGFYGRAYVTGTELAAVVGYASLNKLARMLRRDDVPDLDGWLNLLDPEPRAICEQILGITLDTLK